MLCPYALMQTIFSGFIGAPLAILGVGANGFNLYHFYRGNIISRVTRLLLISASTSEIVFLVLIAIYCTVKMHRSCLERLLHCVKPLGFGLIWSRKAGALAVALIIGLACLMRLPSLAYNLHHEAKAISLNLAQYVYLSHLLADRIRLALLPECTMIGTSVATAVLVKRWSRERCKLQDLDGIFLSLFAYGVDYNSSLLFGLFRRKVDSWHEGAVGWTGGGDEPVLSP
ncbi:hypothetical protein TcWFU_007102 [Taenia crassiceps]|uniref:Uncharacterized protein n=1 Tax=Taenia crassiceps TaxID=6207 RepID=A0ABR4Q3M6_9CEST